MHRRLTFHGDSEALGSLANELALIEGVIGLAHVREASLKPPGDVLQVDVLNRDADQALRRARPRLEDRSKKITLVISQTNAVIDHDHTHLIATDADEALWEEMESDLRNHGRLSTNYLLLMALGGVIAAAGFMLEPVSQAIAFVGASIIAPGFEPIAKLAQGLVLRETKICLRALLSLLVGYAVLFAAASLFIFGMSLLTSSDRPHAALMAQPVLGPLTHLAVAPVVTSACAAVAGIIMVVSLRDLYVVGPLMVLVTIPGVALAAAALVTGEASIALGAMKRVAADFALIVILGAAVFYWKQRSFHRRRPLS
jgi:hypothetical protein